jgi:hypothetical protein
MCNQLHAPWDCKFRFSAPAPARRSIRGLQHLGGAAAWPLAARAQQPERMRRIGVLPTVPADDSESQVRMAAFHQGLQEAGWVVGRNLRIDYRWSSAGSTRPLPPLVYRIRGGSRQSR